MDTKDYLIGWVFTCGEDGIWRATIRDNYSSLFNDYTSPKVIRSKSFSDLQALIIKMKGELDLKYLKSLEK